MSLYNALFGQNPKADVFLMMLKLDREKVGRFRDAFLTERDDKVVIGILTRNGGGNRACWDPESCDGHCAGCRMKALKNHLQYLDDADDDFDSTYATVYFSIPDNYVALVGAMRAAEENVVISREDEPMARFKRLLDKLQAGEDNDPEVKRALEVGRHLTEQIATKLKVPSDG